MEVLLGAMAPVVIVAGPAASSSTASHTTNRLPIAGVTARATTTRLLRSSDFPSGWTGPSLPVTTGSFSRLPACENVRAPKIRSATVERELFTAATSYTNIEEVLMSFRTDSEARKEVRLLSDQTAVNCLRKITEEDFASTSDASAGLIPSGSRLHLTENVTQVVGVKIEDSYTAHGKSERLVSETLDLRSGAEVARISFLDVGIPLSPTPLKEVLKTAATRLRG